MVLKEIRERNSGYLYGEREVEKEKIEELILAAQWAPSSANKQPWHYVFVSKKDSTRAALEEALARGNFWAKEAPYLVAVSATPPSEAGAVAYYAYDTGASVMNFVLEAVHQGLTTRQMGGFDQEKAKQALGIPPEQVVLVIIALGYPQDKEKVIDSLDERLKEKLKRTPSRKPHTENFFFEKFGNKKQARE